jgi:hypothetical protein
MKDITNNIQWQCWCGAIGCRLAENSFAVCSRSGFYRRVYLFALALSAVPSLQEGNIRVNASEGQGEDFTRSINKSTKG